MFAKMFGTDKDQIVAMLKTGDVGPEIRLFFQPEGLGVCETALVYDFKSYSSEDAAWEKAESVFKNLSEEDAKKILGPVISQFAGLAGTEETTEFEGEQEEEDDEEETELK
jgi:hypothetical protein